MEEDMRHDQADRVGLRYAYMAGFDVRKGPPGPQGATQASPLRRQLMLTKLSQC